MDFIKTLKKREYFVIEHLNKLPAQISILSLLLSSEGHKEALLKSLNESYVLESIATKILKIVWGKSLQRIHFYRRQAHPWRDLVDKIVAYRCWCSGMIVARVLIDNVFTLNFCLVMTSGRIGIKDTSICSNGMMICTFKGTKAASLGEIEIPFVTSGPCDLRYHLLSLTSR